MGRVQKGGKAATSVRYLCSSQEVNQMLSRMVSPKRSRLLHLSSADLSFGGELAWRHNSLTSQGHAYTLRTCIEGPALEARGGCLLGLLDH